ncbi:ATP-binding protein [Magnetovibrio sp.]|uniref:ATP-binding protein n=1 Tax=Magnetovibrio sp. TaxID=2024836 RepID=UPI002F9427A9
MLGRSVSLRLILISVAWIVATLAVGGWVLSQHFRTHVENSFDYGLERHVEELLSYTEVVDGKVGLSRRPTDPSYLRPLSGWYWELTADGVVIERSRSLWDQVLPIKPIPNRGQATSFFMYGPREEKLRVVAEAFTLPGYDKDVLIYFTGPASVIDRATEEFTETLTTSLLLLGLGLMAAVVLQVILGLRPLKLVRQKLGAIHAGETERMTGVFPSEVEPLVNDLNKLLDHNAEVIERARTHAGNLAHALKTPLAVLGNEADGMEGQCAATLREQVSTMNDLVTRHLARARAAGGLGVPGLKADVGEIASGLKRTLQRIYQRKNDGAGVSIALVNVREHYVVGDRQDVEEMLGNLLDNACKWAASRVRVTGAREGREIVLSIDDDGPGIPADLRDDVLKRGKRLDEATPGSGLGLNIVHELAELYHGSLSLDESDLGGLSVRLRLPAA